MLVFLLNNMQLTFPAELSAPFSECERLVWRPPEEMTVSDWADRYACYGGTAAFEIYGV